LCVAALGWALCIRHESGRWGLGAAWSRARRLEKFARCQVVIFHIRRSVSNIKSTAAARDAVVGRGDSLVCVLFVFHRRER
jgi:hypothetical protein